MTDDLVTRLRELDRLHSYADKCEAAARIEKLVEENGVLFAANVRLNSRADLDSDGYVDRIEKLEAALREIVQEDALTGKTVFVGDFGKIARKALEGKDD